MINKLTEVFRFFQEHNVKYLIIGGIAANIHGVPRSTFDLDIIIEATRENANRLLKALLKAEYLTAELTTAEKILEHEITIFKDKVRIDVQTKTPGISFEEAWTRKVTVTYQKQQFFVVSKQDLISSKKAAGRPKDLEDIRLLELGGA
jgi:hypothetical protein